MGNTIKFTCDSYGYLDALQHVTLTNASWNLKTDDIITVADCISGITADTIPASIRTKYGIARSSDIVCPGTGIMIKDPTILGYENVGEVFYLINTNVWVDLWNTQTVLAGDIKDATKTTELILNAMTAKPGNGVIDLGDLNKLGYTFMYMASNSNESNLYWRIDGVTNYNTLP